MSRRCEASLDVDLQALDEVEELVDHTLCRCELGFEELQVPYLLISITCWHVLINLYLRLSLAQELLHLPGQLHYDEFVD